MADRKIRIYEGNNAETSFVGFSLRAWDTPKQPAFKQFMAERGYEWDWTNDRPAETVSVDHIEVHPPLSDEHIQELATLCIGGRLKGEWVEGIVHAGQNSVYVIDNRYEVPISTYHGGEYVFPRTEEVPAI
jgi:hypothetical protein